MKDPEIQKLVLRLDPNNQADNDTLAEILLKSVLADNGEWDIIKGKYLTDSKAQEAYINALNICLRLKAKDLIDFKYSRISTPYECHFIDITLKANDDVLEIPSDPLVKLLETTLVQNDEEGKFLTIRKRNPLEWSLSYKIYYEA